MLAVKLSVPVILADNSQKRLLDSQHLISHHLHKLPQSSCLLENLMPTSTKKNIDAELVIGVIVPKCFFSDVKIS